MNVVSAPADSKGTLECCLNYLGFVMGTQWASSHLTNLEKSGWKKIADALATPTAGEQAANAAQCRPTMPATNDYISIRQAAEMRDILPQNVSRKAKKHGILEYHADHPVVSKEKWCNLNGIDPNKPVRRKRRISTSKAAARSNALRDDDALLDDINDDIEDWFAKHHGRCCSVQQILALLQTKYPHLKRINVEQVLQNGKKRGDYEEDEFGNWFRQKPT